MKYKKYIIGSLILLALFCTITVLMQPLIINSLYARFKSTDHFLALEGDQRIWFEDGSELNAEKVSTVISERINEVESILNSSFKEPVQIYICDTQESFNEYVFLSKNVRGAVYWGKLFLSPGAFNRGSLDDLLEHELTHYLFNTNLGARKHLRNVPLWFREGIAVFVANNVNSQAQNRYSAGRLTLSEKSSFLSGDLDYWFYSDNPLDAVTEGGVANFTLYKVGAIVIQHLHDTDLEGFNELVQLLLSGSGFEEALENATHNSVESLLRIVKDELSSK